MGRAVPSSADDGTALGRAASSSADDGKALGRAVPSSAGDGTGFGRAIPSLLVFTRVPGCACDWSLGMPLV